MSLTVALAQSNFMAGHFEGNVARITGLYNIAAVAKADLVVFPEMAMTGYPTEDMVLRRQFQDLSMQTAEAIARQTIPGTAMLAGGLWREGDALYNTAFLMEGGNIVHRQHKHHLPNYGVFDEKRHFAAGAMPEPIEWHGVNLGVLVCEDMWLPDVAAHLKRKGAELLIALNASPFETGKAHVREHIAAERARETGLPLVYVNPVGGQDEIVFDGGSFALSAHGEITLRAKAFQDELAFLHFEQQEAQWLPERGIIQPEQGELEAMYCAMVVGLRDFVDKNGFSGVVLGMSGGIDSALSAAVAVDALGSSRVRAVMMPSPVTSPESLEDAAECAKRLGVPMDIIPIEPGMRAFDAMLAAPLNNEPFDALAANNQTRLRCSILMAIGGKEKFMVLNTGNKSEMAVGYTNLYGDMNGYYSVLKDVYKTAVYKVAAWRNTQGQVIPERILTKAPSAELLPNQTDQDTLPPYEVLDAILFQLVERQLSIAELAAQGFERGTVEQVARKLFFAEHKRRQAPPGLKITSMSFGRDWRYPLTSGWRG